MSDNGPREIQLQGKQLVFLFIAATVVAVVVFLSGVMVGRGVRTRQTAVADTIIDPTVPTEGVPAATATSTGGSKETLSYPGYLEGTAPPPESITEPPPPAVERRPEPARGAVPDGRNAAPNATQTDATTSTAAFTEPKGSGFVVQVAASRERAEAERMARRLAAKGYPTFVTTSGTGTARMFRVRVGKYGDRREAELVSRRLATEEQFKPWITR